MECDVDNADSWSNYSFDTNFGKDDKLDDEESGMKLMRKKMGLLMVQEEELKKKEEELKRWEDEIKSKMSTLMEIEIELRRWEKGLMVNEEQVGERERIVALKEDTEAIGTVEWAIEKGPGRPKFETSNVPLRLQVLCYNFLNYHHQKLPPERRCVSVESDKENLSLARKIDPEYEIDLNIVRAIWCGPLVDDDSDIGDGSGDIEDFVSDEDVDTNKDTEHAKDIEDIAGKDDDSNDNEDANDDGKKVADADTTEDNVDVATDAIDETGVDVADEKKKRKRRKFSFRGIIRFLCCCTTKSNRVEPTNEELDC